ncbi:DUF4064 domain-containing protein [Bacillus sp. TL12]|uniref:DUF4064 domain-containing protein n=1 Tax=Bacillus sp. TL12 TaxID=2894756 RepID=UPI001F519525|nr:DUF4064 domain-containing protein [Bacillus sp. TL12]MCI0768159.1 DUF4064 domain-containing protein [Bacillus sp. TL12]
MKHTGEITLGIIGIIIYAFFLMIGGFIIWLANNEGFMKSLLEKDPSELTADQLNNVIDSMTIIGWLIVLSFLAAIILGVLSIKLIKGNKGPKTSGLLFITTAILTSIITIGIGVFGGIFYLIAGIICLMKRKKQPS